jgi:hypothetical protein
MFIRGDDPGGRPPFLPLALAAAKPALVLSKFTNRFNRHSFKGQNHKWIHTSTYYVTYCKQGKQKQSGSDSQMAIVKQTIELQKIALAIVKVQKEAAITTESAVQKFQAEVLASRSQKFETLQNIEEAENKINMLLGRFSEEIKRYQSNFFEY